MFKQYGDIIGMTLVPECQLARELGMCYCSLATVTDYDVWHEVDVSTEIVRKTMNESIAKVLKLLELGVPRIKKKDCICIEAAEKGGAL